MPDETDPAAAAARDFSRAIDELIAFYLAHGCPCRFPRFRSTCARDTGEVGAAGYTTAEQQSLVLGFDVAVRIAGRQRTRRGFQGKCTVCGAKVERWAEEHFRDVSFEYMRIMPAKGVSDVGEPLHAPLPHCGPFFGAGPTNRSAEQVLEISYPKIPVEDWLVWMRELRSPA
jgi:hypothetical protein